MKCITVLLLAAGFTAAEEFIPRIDIEDEWREEWSEPGFLAEQANVDATARGLPLFDEKLYAQSLGWTFEEEVTNIKVIKSDRTRDYGLVNQGEIGDVGFSLTGWVELPNVIAILDPPTLAFYSGDSIPNVYELPKATSILGHPKFDKGKPTVIYIHGFLGKLSGEDVKAVVAAYAARNDHNILVLDWHSQAVPGYFLHAVKNVYKVGAQAAGAILDMIDKGLNVKHLHIVGHSLGGQMAGVIGRTVYKESNETIKLPRLSALDPAYPGFYGYTNAAHLSRDDAELVDVLHTDSGVYGAPMSTGTVDFWPNNKDDQQPGCFVNICSHARSWKYWAESLLLNAPNYFNSVSAKSWQDFKLGNVGGTTPNTLMGFGCLKGFSGDYYLQTNKESPFARGMEGMKYK